MSLGSLLEISNTVGVLGLESLEDLLHVVLQPNLVLLLGDRGGLQLVSRDDVDDGADGVISGSSSLLFVGGDAYVIVLGDIFAFDLPHNTIDQLVGESVREELITWMVALDH